MILINDTDINSTLRKSIRNILLKKGYEKYDPRVVNLKNFKLFLKLEPRARKILNFH